MRGGGGRENGGERKTGERRETEREREGGDRRDRQTASRRTDSNKIIKQQNTASLFLYYLFHNITTIVGVFSLECNDVCDDISISPLRVQSSKAFPR